MASDAVPGGRDGSWAHFAHDADIGVSGCGPTKTEAFRQTALALTAVVTAYGEPVDIGRHEPAVEIKGATLTALRVAREAGGWRAQCVVDVSNRSVMERSTLVRQSDFESFPGIQRASYAMPDAHWGSGFPIGGVAAFDPAEGGIVSAGGVARLEPVVCVKG